MNNYIRNLLRKLGFDLVRKETVDLIDAYRKCSSYKIDILSLVVEILNRRKDNYSFLQIGANDGIRDDNLYGLIEKYDLRGIMVEPMPQAFSRLRERYHDNNQIRLINSAISVDSSITLYSFDREYEGNIRLDVFTSFDRDIVERQKEKHNINASIISYNVNCITISNILNRYQVKPDIYIIDTEGYDYHILNQISFDDFRPLFIQFEHAHLANLERDASYDLLISHGYQLSQTDRDAFAYYEQR